MREGYGSHFVCLSVTTLAATYLVCKSKVQYCKVPYGIPNACIVWIPLRTLCSLVLTSFADGKLLNFFPSGTQCSIYTKRHVYAYALYSMLGTCARISESPAHGPLSEECVVAVCKGLSDDEVSSSTIDCIVHMPLIKTH